MKFYGENPVIMFEIAGQLAARLRDTTRRLFDLAFLDVAGRMARTLINLTGKREAAAGPRGVTIRTSRQELARLVGCSRELAGRVLKRPDADGIVETTGRHLILPGPRQST